MATTVGHLHETRVSVTRERDGSRFVFYTYHLRGDEWGYELVMADGHSTSAIEDPNWRNEAAVLEAIHKVAEKLEYVSGYGWCVPCKEEKAVSGMRR